MFSIFVILYLFLGGVGAGLLFAMSLWSLAFYRDGARTFPESEAFGQLKARCFLLGAAVLALSALCLAADLGRPDRILLLFARPTFSLLTLGSFVIVALLLVAGFLAAANMLHIARVPAEAKRVAEVLCAVFSLLMMSYTGVYLGNIEAVAFWNTALVPVLFVLSSLSCGLAALFLVGMFVADGVLLRSRLRWAHGIHAAVVVAEACALAAFFADSLARGGTAEESAWLMLAPDLRLWFLAGVCAFGLAVPALAEAAVLASRRLPGIPVVDALCLAGGFCLRYCIVMAGLH